MKITQIETIRLGEFPNIIWVRLHADCHCMRRTH